jgi:hypothetical protein
VTRLRIKFAATALLAGLAAVSAVQSAQAQTISEVAFERGKSGATISGAIIGDEYVDYTLRAKGGQEMSVTMRAGASNGMGTVYYNILPPGSTGEAIYNSSINGDATTVRLPGDGVYSIRVYQMGADADEGKTSSFEIDVSIK